MSFQDLSEFFEPTLPLPIRGKVYVVQSPDAETGLLVQRLMETGAKQARLERRRAAGETIAPGEELTAEDLASLSLDDDDERSLYRRVLGGTFDEMVADKVPWAMVEHAAMTASFWVNGNVEVAERYWLSAGNADAPKPNREQRRGSKGSGSKTRSRASTSGTRTRPKP